jgi:hypothetical protein
MATIDNKPIPTMEVKVRNSQSSARLYDIRLLLALDKFGFPDSTDTEWSAFSLASDARKKQFVDALTAWAMQLQDSVNLAMGFDKPQDVFQKVPPVDSLLPTLVQPSPRGSKQSIAMPSPVPVRSSGTSYVYCESMKKMIAEDGTACPSVN